MMFWADTMRSPEVVANRHLRRMEMAVEHDDSIENVMNAEVGYGLLIYMECLEVGCLKESWKLNVRGPK